MQLEKLGKYELLERLGRGTSADVYLAKDTMVGKQVALKVVVPETDDFEPLLKEGQLLARMSHPNVVRINTADVIDGKVLIDMEYLPYPTLKQLLRDQKQLSPDRALKITAQVLNALSYARSMGVIHRDIKPANILVGNEDTVKVVDFGIADVLLSHGYLAGAGTFSHMAPEAFEDKTDERSDLWSVGVLLYEMLTGELPFRAEKNTLTAWKAVVDKAEKPKPLSGLLPNIPNGLQGVVSLALTHNKSKRFQTADAFLEILKRNGFYKLPNTEAELREIDRFEAAYNRIDKHLRGELRVDRKVGFADVVRQYAQQHPEWHDEKDLLRLARVRNQLRHGMIDANQYRPIPAMADIERLETMEQGLSVRRVSIPNNEPEKNDTATPQDSDSGTALNSDSEETGSPSQAADANHIISAKYDPALYHPAQAPKSQAPKFWISGRHRAIRRTYIIISLLLPCIFFMALWFNRGYESLAQWQIAQQLNYGHDLSNKQGATGSMLLILSCVFFFMCAKWLTDHSEAEGGEGNEFLLLSLGTILLTWLCAGVMFVWPPWDVPILFLFNHLPTVLPAWIKQSTLLLLAFSTIPIAGVVLRKPCRWFTDLLPDDGPLSGSPHPTQANVCAKYGNQWMPAPGYVWQSTSTDSLAVLWTPGTKHPDKYIVSSSQERRWAPAPGFTWAEGGRDQLKVVWGAGQRHPVHEYLIAVDRPGYWKPAAGYEWINDKGNNLDVRAMAHNTVAQSAAR